MRIPAHHTADAIKHMNCYAEIDGKWWLARPEPYYNWKERWKLSWMGLIGKADAVTWIGQ